MNARRLALGLLLGTLLSVPAPVAAQDAPDVKSVMLDDLRTMRDKYVALGSAFSGDQLDWRPMEGVRSVRDVLALAAAEGTLFPTGWGFDAPDGVEGDFGAEMERLGTLSHEDLVAAVGSGFDHMIGILEGLDHDALHAPADFFGTPMMLEAAFMMGATDMHEHLGQLIAYARTNEVVPPWSR